MEGIKKIQYHSELPLVVFSHVDDIVNIFNQDLDFLALTWSFSVWEESYSEEWNILSDIDYYAVLKKNVSDKVYIKKILDFCKSVNWIKNPVDPDCSVWVTSYEKFYIKKDDTLIPYQIKETQKLLYWTLDFPPSSPIELNSKLWLCWVAYAQLLSWIKKKDYKSLAKAVFNQIWVFLISKDQYTTSYKKRISRFLPYLSAFDITENDLNDAFSIKIHPSQNSFVQKFGDVKNFLDIFSKLFSFSTLQQIFGNSTDLKTFCDSLVKDWDFHKYIRVAYICYYLKDYKLANYYIKIVSEKMNFFTQNKWLNRLDNVWTHWLQQIEGVTS